MQFLPNNEILRADLTTRWLLQPFSPLPPRNHKIPRWQQATAPLRNCLYMYIQMRQHSGNPVHIIPLRHLPTINCAGVNAPLVPGLKLMQEILVCPYQTNFLFFCADTYWVSGRYLPITKYNSQNKSISIIISVEEIKLISIWIQIVGSIYNFPDMTGTEGVLAGYL